MAKLSQELGKCPSAMNKGNPTAFCAPQPRLRFSHELHRDGASANQSVVRTQTLPRCKRQVRCAAQTPSRRSFIHLSLLSLSSPFLPQSALAKPTATESLLPLVRLQSSLSDLSISIEEGTNGDVRRVVTTLLKAYDVPSLIRSCSMQLPKERREAVRERGKQAFEYLSQVVEYYDAMAVKKRGQPEMIQFCLQAVQKADEGFQSVIGEFSDDVVRDVRTMVENGA